jgi:hypothetical protein
MDAHNQCRYTLQSTSLIHTHTLTHSHTLSFSLVYQECNFPSIVIHAGLKQEDRIARFKSFKVLTTVQCHVVPVCRYGLYYILLAWRLDWIVVLCNLVYCIVLHYFVLYCTVRYCTVSYSTTTLCCLLRILIA